MGRMGTLLIACPSCSCHAFARETHCPSCGGLLRASDGSIQRTAGAMLLGLTLTVGVAACDPGSTGGGGGNMGGYVAVTSYGAGPSISGGFGGNDYGSSGFGGNGAGAGGEGGNRDDGGVAQGGGGVGGTGSGGMGGEGGMGGSGGT